MADREQLYNALRNADAAGDVEGARKLAAYIQSMPQDAPAAMPAPAAKAPESRGFLRSAGDVLAGAVRGAGSIGATALAPIDIARDAIAGKGLSLESNRQRRADMDAALGELGADTNSWAYKGGKLAGEVAGTAGMGGAVANVAGRGLGAVAPSLLPRAQPLLSAIQSGGMTAPGAGMLTRTAGGAITGGATAAAVNPEDVVSGAVAGGAMPGAVRALGSVGSAVGRQLRPGGDSAQLARKAIDMGAPLGIADVAEGKFTKAVRSVLNDAPLTGGIGAAQNDAKQKWFNRAVGEVFDAADDKLTPQVMDAAKQKMGAEFDRIWSNNSLKVDNQLLTTLSKTRANASMLPKAERSRIVSMLDDLEGQVVQAADGSMVIPGEVANRYQSSIRKASESAQGFLKNDLTNLRKDVIGAFNRSVSADDAAALALNQRKYKAFKTVEPLLNKGELGVAGREAGDVPAGLLPGAVLQSYKSNPAGSPLAELSKMGSKYLVDRSPQTGGSARALIQNSAIGGALGVGMFSNPLLAAGVIPAGMGLNQMLGSPMLARGLLSAQAPQMGGLLSFGQKVAPVLTAQ
jgi:hypothetical protein